MDIGLRVYATDGSVYRFEPPQNDPTWKYGGASLTYHKVCCFTAMYIGLTPLELPSQKRESCGRVIVLSRGEKECKPLSAAHIIFLDCANV